MEGCPDVIIIGAGGHAKVVLDLIRAEDRFRPLGFLDQDPTPRNVLGLPVLGKDSLLPELRRSGVAHAFVAVGDNRLRVLLGHRLVQAGFQLINAISPAAVISPSACVGGGVAVMPGAVVNADTRIEDLAIINTRASVDHDGHIGEGAHVGPGCALAGNVTIGPGAFLGVGVSVIPGIAIGQSTVIGAGACVVRDIPPGVVARGVPARVVRDDIT